MPVFCVAQGSAGACPGQASLSTRGVAAVLAPRASEATQAEDEECKGGQQGPRLEVEAGGP